MKMERLYKFTYSLLVAALLSIPFNSCIKEDMDDCPSNIRVYFDYLPATYATIKEGIDPMEVTRMDLYWFDAETNILLGMEVDENPELGPEYYMTIPTLKTGEYKFIAWGNLTGCYSLMGDPIVGTTTLDQLSTNLNTLEGDSVKNNITPLFYGQSGKKEIKQSISVTEVRIPIVKDTYTFNIKVGGQLSTEGQYRIVISDNNFRLGFDNSYIACPTVHYTSYCGAPFKNSLTASLVTMRIGRGRSPVMKVIDERYQATSVFTANLIDLILKLEEQYKIEIDFSQMYEFDIEVIINNGSFAININGWKIIYEENQLFG